MELETTIQTLNPDTFEYQTYSTSDEQLIVQSELDTNFSPSTDYIEYYIYDQNQTLIYPDTTTPLVSYDVREGDIILNPISNLSSLGYDVGIYNILYTFYRKIASSSITDKYFISAISSDRTEIRLDNNTIENSTIISSTNDFIEYRESQPYFVDFYLNFGENQTVIANNLRLETEEGIDPTLLIKLYEPLPLNFNVKDELWLVEVLSNPQAYKVDFPFESFIEDDFTFISGPNYNLNIVSQKASPGEQFSYNTLLNSDITSSINQIQSLLNEKEINININYTDFNNFVHFSSANTRLENFYYKVSLIESYNNELSTFLSQITTNTTTTPSYSSSKATLTGEIDSIIKNFDGYEYFLYFNSGSATSYPKSNSFPPFTLYPTGSTEAQTWLTSSSTIALNYDEENRDWLYWSIPEYLREDQDNRRYELFVDMVGQYYDNVWVYTKDITNKFDADNRLDYGISKDLVSDAIKDFAIKLYSNNFNTDDLFTAFLGLTPSGSSFPFPNITGSLPTPSGFEYVDTKISASNNIVPLDDVNNRVYKRIYHNIPYLLKTKGTVAGIRALITSYGIPDTILRVSEFGGKDKNESQDYDLKQNVFNYAFDTGVDATNYLTSEWGSNPIFPDGESSPKTVQFRFKPASIPLPSNNTPNSNIRYSQSLFSTDDGGNIVLEYTGSGFTSGSYSGSVFSPYDNYGTLKFIPAASDLPSLSASVYLPFFNEDWWSVQVNISRQSSASLFVANKIDGKVGFNASSSIHGFDSQFWEDASNAYLNKNTNITPPGMGVYKPFSGSFQELRYWAQEISQSNFFDYTVNPYSNEGNGVNSTPNQLYFRADLGTQLDTGSRTSIHPRVTGSAVQITSSFDDGSSAFTLNTENWVTNIENIYQDQIPVGIKNRVTDKIHNKQTIIAEAPYGFPKPTSLVPEISSVGNDTQTLSPMESMQQSPFTSQSHTPNIDYLEVAFSPSNQINDDINAQLGYFNLGEYIGDPRFFSSSLDTYPDLDRLRDAYFEKYMSSYDVVDFIRLIKFFDNSLFKMIKDFTPARTSLASGIVIKQHLLERNRQRPTQVTSSLHDYEALVVNLPKNYTSGSSDFPQYSTEGSSIYKFSGGTGGSLERFNGLQTSPSGTLGEGPNNRFGITQSWQDSNSGSVLNTTFFNQSSSQYVSGSYLGPRTWEKSNQSEFYNGIFSGSMIIAVTQSLNPGCEPYLKANDTPAVFKPIFFSLSDEGYNNTLQSVVTPGAFLDQNNVPPEGYAWIASEQTDLGGVGQQQVKSIKLSQNDVSGTEIINYLDNLLNLRIILPDLTLPYNIIATEYIIIGRTIYADHILLSVSPLTSVGGNNFYQTVDNIIYPAITSSTAGGSMNWSLIAKTNYTSSTNNSGSSDLEQQGVFLNPNNLTQEQNYFYWSGSNDDSQPFDALDFFHTGSNSINTLNILDAPSLVEYGSYTIPYTPNIPWVISASLVYSSSIIPSSSIVDSGTYHFSSSYNGFNLTNQNFILGGRSYISTLFRPSPLTVTGLGTIAFNGNNWKKQIPGNSGSGVNMNDYGGHPKIKVDGTASMDWYFPSLTLAGTDPGTGGSIYSEFTSFSGSAITSGNSSFTSSFNNSWGNDTITWANIITDPIDGPYGQNYGGEIGINLVDLQTEISSSTGNTPTFYNLVNLSVDFSTTSNSSTNNYQVKFVYKIYNVNTPNASWKNLTGDILNSTSGVIDVTSKLYSIYIPNTPPTIDGDIQYVVVRALIKNNNSNGSSFNYKITENKVDLRFTYGHHPSSPGGSNLGQYPSSGYINGWGVTNGYFQGSTTNFAGTILSTSNFYSTAIVDIYLKRTGSEGDNIITSSVWDGTSGGYSGSIYSGSVLSFPDTSILDISNPTLFNSSTNPSSSLNKIGDMYYIEYSMSNFVGGKINGIPQTTQNVAFQNNSDKSIIYITQSSATTGPTIFNATGSVILRQSNVSTPTEIGTEVLNMSYDIPDEFQIASRVDLNGTFSGPFKSDDIFRFSSALTKLSAGSGIVVSEFTASIFPLTSIWAPLTASQGYGIHKSPGDTDFLVPTFYGANILPFNLALDCQPLLNNYSQGRLNPFLMDVDYNVQSDSSSLIPANQTQILENTAVRAQTPESNYTQLSSINPRYDGVKSTSAKINVWSVGDTGTYGKNPTVELRDAFFGYFSDLDDPYPNINGLTRANISYLIDEQGNALPPSLDELSIDTFKAVFPNTSVARLAIQKGDNKYKSLGEPSPIKRMMQYVTPICYSQNSGDNYSPSIPLSGSGYISRYDNDDSNGINFAQFMAAGTASISNTTFPLVTSVDYVLDPSEANTSLSPSVSPYTASSGTTSYPPATWGGSVGDDLNNEQIISLQTSIVTSYVSETKGISDELHLNLLMLDNNTSSRFNLESIDCKVYTDDGNVYLLKDVEQYGWFNIVNIPGWRSKIQKGKKDWNRNRWKYSKLPISDNGIFCTVAAEMYVTLFNLGLMQQLKPTNGSGVQALEWIFTANSGNYSIKVGSNIKWKIVGTFETARKGHVQGVFFPPTYPGKYTPVKLQGAGTKDYLSAGDNAAQAPFWIFPGSDKKIIEMSSSNFNEAYGTSFYQGNLPYYPGFSQYFPGNVEPIGTNFDEITLPLEIQENDEIRFGNNENFTYRVLEVFTPSENVVNGNARVKLKLDKPIDNSVNKDFFLIRRQITSPNSLYLDSPFPYSTLTSESISTGVVEYTGSRFALTGSITTGSGGNANLSGSYTASYSTIEQSTTPGIIYPDFPTKYLIQSASIIVNNLISKGVIQS